MRITNKINKLRPGEDVKVTGEIWANVTIDTTVPARVYDPMIFGGFLEHFDTQIYDRVFEPGSPHADKQGFRLDVIKALKELKTPTVRWPGGCFVDSYHWQNGIGENRHPLKNVICTINMEELPLDGTYQATILTTTSSTPNVWCRKRPN